MTAIAKVISGGQTGIDRLALEVARELGIPTGGWAPKGYLTERGPDPTLADFGLVQHPSAQYPARTKANVRMADGTIWLGAVGETVDSRGLRCTHTAADTYGKPFLFDPTAQTVRGWMAQWDIRVLNVAGPRGSRCTPAALAHAADVLREALR